MPLIKNFSRCGWAWFAFAVVSAIFWLHVPTLPFSAAEPPRQDRTRATARFSDVAARLGIKFTYFNDSRPERYFLPEVMGGGAAWIDFDGDGRLDLYFVNGCELPHDPSDRKHTSQLFRNHGSRFSSVTDEAGVGHNGYGQGCAVGDLDNDGFDDLLVTCYGENVLYQNQGDGTFREITARAGVGSDPRWHTSAACGDLDRDGNLDLYICRYVKTSLDEYPQCWDRPSKTLRVFCGPAEYQAEQDLLFHNNGAGSFRDATRSAGCDKGNGKGLAVIIAHLDHDGWPDIFVANDMTPGFLFHNLRSEPASGPRFEEIGLRAGVALTGEGQPVAGMGIACGDYDGDGWQDLCVTAFYEQGSVLYYNMKGKMFLDRSTPTGLKRLSYHTLGFGTGFTDYDRDGWLDMFTTNGHVLGPNIEPESMRPQLYRNEAGKRFVDATDSAGDYFGQKWIGRGATFGDFDNDGAEDIVVVHHCRPAALLHNETPGRGHFVQLQLVGRESNRSAVGARVQIHAGSRSLLREVIGGGSYLAANDRRLIAGLGTHQAPVSIEIEWPSGRKETWQDVQVDARYLVIEGSRPLILR